MLALDTRAKFATGRHGPMATFVFAAFAALVTLAAITASPWYPSLVPAGIAHSPEASNPKARLNEQVSIRTSGSHDPTLSLADGHDLVTAYQGPARLQRALEQNEVQARSLASADFDEDGVPDLVSGYAYDGPGITTVHPGNVVSIYPNTPEAGQRKASGPFTAAPFLSPALALEVSAPADFLGAGDFDADGHWDIVFASRAGTSLHCLPGDGRGGFGSEQEIALSGGVTALATAEINRRDGLTDIVIGVAAADGPKVFVFEGPLGAIHSRPEIFAVTKAATSLALGQLDDHYAMDLAIASGNELLLVHGRDRKLTLPVEDQATVPAAGISERYFPFTIRALTIGEFTGDGFSDIALLADNGSVEVLAQPGISTTEWQQLKARADTERSSANTVARMPFDEATELPSSRARNDIAAWTSETLTTRASVTATSLLFTHVSTSRPDDLVLLGSSARKMQVISPN